MSTDLLPRTFVRLLGGVVLALTVALLSGVSAQEDPAVIEVGTDQVITESEFEEEFQRAVRSLAAQQGIPYNEETRARFAEFREDFLEQLAVQEALLQEAETRGITVTEEEVEQQITQAREQLGGEEQFEQALQDLGYESIEAFRESIREGLLAQRAADEIRAGIEVSDEEVRGFYEDNPELFGDAEFDQVQEQARGELLNQRITQEFTALQDEYAVETFPERITALGESEDGVAGGGVGAEDEGAEDETEDETESGATEEGEEGVVAEPDFDTDMEEDPDLDREVEQEGAAADDEDATGEDTEDSVGGQDGIGADDDAGAGDDAGADEDAGANEDEGMEEDVQ